MPEPFAVERAAFTQFKQECEKDTVLKNDIETALTELLGRFSTAIYENRFVVGGALEVIMVAALRAAGVEAVDIGAREERLDIRIPDGGFSVKGHFRGSGDIRLINVLGDSSQAKWEEATLFVLHGVGIGYADPNLLASRNVVRRVGDAIVAHYTTLKAFFAQNSHWLIECAVPQSLQNEGESE
ncbi:MAG: hypothetical protein N2651_06945, partial [Fimbriimonadales bacterium]|nr:hypothetical protein [Fimbriimonadales bacterium]